MCNKNFTLPFNFFSIPGHNPPNHGARSSGSGVPAVVPLPRDAGAAPDLPGRHAALRRRKALHTADTAVAAAYY